jgi:hypothetical protein
MFPFEVPADLTALSADEFAALQKTVNEFAKATAADDSASEDLIIATAELFSSVKAESGRRSEVAGKAKAARAELAAGLAPAEPEGEEDDEVEEPAPVSPAPAPSTPPAPAPERVEARSTIDTPPVTEEKQKVGSLIASADAPTRGPIKSFADVGKLLDTQFGRYGRPGAGARGGKTPTVPGGSRFVMEGGRSVQRHSIAAIQREYPAEFRITESGKKALDVLEHARSERRLPGGSLAKSAQAQVDAGKALTAAAGWCAPSEILYDLCSLSSMDGMLDIPAVQAARGGFQIPANGGPNFATIYNSIGDGGDVILTEYEVENGAEKVCVEVPCPDFVDVRLDVAYFCLTGNLLQTRGYPEAVTHFSQEAITALAHKVNASMIARLVAGSTAPVTIAEATGSTDAASNVLSAVELAIMDMRYRNRMSLAATVEVVFPAWVIGPIRAAMARRRGVAELAVSDSEIVSWFTVRGARVQFVYDWQDAFTGGAFGGTGSATAFPTTVNFLVYPAGTWVKGEADVINLDTIYDNAMLTQNQYTALFVEDGLSAMKMCADSRLYTTNVNPAGITACCP